MYENTTVMAFEWLFVLNHVNRKTNLHDGGHKIKLRLTSILCCFNTHRLLENSHDAGMAFNFSGGRLTSRMEYQWFHG